MPAPLIRLLVATIVLTTAGVAQAQTVIVLEGGTTTTKLYVSVDPALLKEGADHKLQSVKDEYVTISIASYGKPTCAEQQRVATDMFVEPIPRPSWAPASYDASAIDAERDGSYIELCLERAEGAWSVTVSRTDDLPAIANALDAIVAGSTTGPPLPDMEFAVGDKVAAKSSYGGWAYATITAIRPEGTYDVIFDYITGSRSGVPPEEVTTTDIMTEGKDGETPAPSKRKPPRGYPYGVGVALQYDYYAAHGLYSSVPDATRYEVSANGFSAAVDYDSRRAVRKPKEKLGVLPDLAKLVGGGRAMAGKVSTHGVEFDVQGWLGYRLGFVMGNITPMVGVGADGVGLDGDLADGGFPTAGYWFIGASFNGERATELEAGYDITIARMGRVGDDIVDSEVRVSATASIHGWFGGANINFYGDLGITTLMAGKRF